MKVTVTHIDGHNYPLDLEFKTMEEAVAYIEKTDPMGDTTEHIHEELDSGMYVGCDQWILKEDK